MAECPSPYVPDCTFPPPPATTTTIVRIPPGDLPDTGSNMAGVGFAGVLLVGFGIIAVIAGRRRRERDEH